MVGGADVISECFVMPARWGGTGTKMGEEPKGGSTGRGSVNADGGDWGMFHREGEI